MHSIECPASSFIPVSGNIFIVCLFAGDLGGYLGLLIGGSTLTIIEVVDLIFYNSLLKCCRRRSAANLT